MQYRNADRPLNTDAPLVKTPPPVRLFVPGVETFWTLVVVFVVILACAALAK